MTVLREKAREIRAAGEAERGNFTPHGVPLRMYNYWLSRSGSKKANAINCGSRRENFCHFWRVVAIWAPLLFVGRGVAKVLDHPVTLPLFIFVAALTAIVAAVVTGAWVMLLAALGLGLAVIAGSLALVLAGFYIKDKWWTPTATRYAQRFLLGLGVLTGVSCIVLGLVFATLDFGWVFWLWLVAVLAFVGLTIWGLSALATYISGKRAIAREKHREAWDKYLSGEGPNPNEREVREPGLIAKFFSGLGDFLILIFQVVRVNKWKICPVVDTKELTR